MRVIQLQQTTVDVELMVKLMVDCLTKLYRNDYTSMSDNERSYATYIMKIAYKNVQKMREEEGM